MKDLRTILAISALGIGLAACNNTAPLASEGPLFDGGGYTIGSGSRLVEPDSTQTMPAGTSTTETPAGGSSTERGGGYTIGSGS